MSNLHTHNHRLHELVAKAQDNIKQALALHPNTNFYVGTSGGKDSLTIKSLVASVTGKPFDVIHNSKPMPFTHPETQAFIYYKLSTEYPIVLMPSELMPSYCAARGYTLQFDGTRTAEFDRQEKSDDFIREGKSVNRTELEPYIETGIFNISVSYPIFDWTDADVFAYLESRGIELSGEYRGEYPLIWENPNVA